MFHDVERPFARIFPFKKQFGRKTRKLITCLLDVLKTTLVKSMNRFFKVSKVHANLFSVFWTSKFRLCVSFLSDVSIRRMALRTHNLREGRLKKLLWWSRWSYVSKCRKAEGKHFLHPGHSEWTDFQGDERLSERIFCLLVIEKSELDEVV
jgi:hypothetical protein